jgi:digeranylgeranylglycerophospholipid reductase
LISTRHDVAVIGAGPAGALAAQTLADRGRDVVVLEEHADVGAPTHCTGLLGHEAFDEFDLPRRVILGVAESARFFGASGQSITVRSDRISASVVDRRALDETLVERARAAGAEVRTGSRVDRIAIDSDGVQITVSGADREIRARAVVLACGANYRFHKGLGLGAPGAFLQSAQLEAPFPDSTDVEIQLGREVAPGGFGWLVPLRRGTSSCARIGLMSETRSRERFRLFLGALMTRAGLQASSFPEPRLKMLPLGPVVKTSSDRVLAVGDAAGLVKPTTGGGIYYGLISGRLAGEVLGDALVSGRLDAADLRVYDARWRRRLGHEIRIGLAFRRLAARLTDESIDSLIELARVNGIVPLLQRTASFNWHSTAAIALLSDASFRKLVLKSWRSALTV